MKSLARYVLLFSLMVGGNAGAVDCTSGDGNQSCSCEKKCVSDFYGCYCDDSEKSIDKQTLSQTDVLSVVNARLAGLRNYKLGEQCQRVKVDQKCTEDCMGPAKAVSATSNDEKLHRCFVHCRDVFATQCRPIMGKLRAKGTFTIEKEPVVSIDTPNWADIPSSILGHKQKYRNCSSKDQSITFDHNETVITGYVNKKSKTLVATKSITTKVGFNFKNIFNTGRDWKQDVQTTINSSEDESHQTTSIYKVTQPLIVGKMSEIEMEHTWVRREVPIAYHGHVQLDMDIDSNQEGITKLSQVLTNPDDRQFEFAGVLLNSLVFEGDTKVIETIPTTEECNTQATH